MGVVETTLVGGAVAVGGWFLVKRMNGWDPQGAGAAVARGGTKVTDQLGRVTETTGKVAGSAIRGGGQLSAKSAGLAVSTVGAVATTAGRAVPGVGRKASKTSTASAAPVAASTDTSEVSPTRPAKKAPAKKAPAKKATAKKTAAKKAPAKKATAKKAPAEEGTAKKATAKKALSRALLITPGHGCSPSVQPSANSRSHACNLAPLRWVVSSSPVGRLPVESFLALIVAQIIILMAERLFNQARHLVPWA